MQYPAMRRPTRALPDEQTLEILSKATYGVLSTTGVIGAYGAPINYVYADGHIYGHCAEAGHKLDNIAHDNRVCFTVVEADPQIVPEHLSTRYRSAIAFGTAVILEGEAVRAPLIKLCEALTPGCIPDYLKDGAIDRRVRVIDITVAYVSGKFNPG